VTPSAADTDTAEREVTEGVSFNLLKSEVHMSATIRKSLPAVLLLSCAGVLIGVAAAVRYASVPLHIPPFEWLIIFCLATLNT
jgi:hypothetical protein